MAELRGSGRELQRGSCAGMAILLGTTVRPYRRAQFTADCEGSRGSSGDGPPYVNLCSLGCLRECITVPCTTGAGAQRKQHDERQVGIMAGSQRGGMDGHTAPGLSLAAR